MKVGIHLPQWGSLATRAAVLEVACAAEEADLDSVWVADHIAYPIESRTAYPYRSKGLPFSSTDGFLEAITQLAVVSGATSRVRLGTSVLVLPMREPLLAATMLATLDVLSDGRCSFAVGAGWWREEFDVVAAPFDGRGRRMDEQIAILKTAWQHGIFAHHGSSYDFETVASLPLPVQPGGPPLLIGGNGSLSWRRAAAVGDGWHAVGLTVAALRDGRDRIAAIAQTLGRDPDRLTYSTSSGMARSPDETVTRLGEFLDAGIDQVVLNIGTGDADLRAYRRAIDELGESVLPQLAGR